MLLSPIFLALGAVATSVLNAGGRFAAAAIAPIVYNLAIIGGGAPPGPVDGRRRASRSASSRARSATCSSSCRPLRAPRLPLRAARSTPADREARKALTLMAPRAIGLGATQITFVVVTALASTARRRGGHRLQRRVHAAPDPDRGHRRAAWRRRAARRCRARPRSGDETDVRRAADPGPAAARLRDGPDRGARRGRSAHEVVDLLFDYGQFDGADLDADRGDAAGLPRRPRGARADRRAGPGVLRPPGHAHPGPRRGRRRRHQHDPRGRPRRAARAPGIALAIAVAAWLEAIALLVDPAPPASPRFELGGLAAWSGCALGGRHGRRGGARRSARAGAARACARAPTRASSSLVVEIAVVGAVVRRSSTPASRSSCGSRNCRLSSGSWSTCSAARAGRDGDPADRPDRPGTRSSRRATPARTSSSRLGRRQGRQRLARPPDRRRRRRTAPIGAQILVRRPRPDAVGLRLRAARPGGRGLDGRRRSRPSPTTVRDGLRGRAGRVSHLRIDPEIELDGPLDPDGALRARPARRRLAARAADPAGLDPGHRPARRRGRALGRPAQEVAPVRQQGPGRRGRRRRRRGRPARRVLPDLPRDRGPGRVPDPDRGRVPRRLGGLPPGRPGPAAVRPDRRRRAPGDAVPRPQRAAGRRAVRRHDRGRRRDRGPTTCSSGRPSAPRASRAPRATTCGASRPAGSPTSRPASVAGRSATSGPGTSCSIRSGGAAYEVAQRGPGLVGAPAPRRSAATGAPPPAAPRAAE